MALMAGFLVARAAEKPAEKTDPAARQDGGKVAASFDKIRPGDVLVIGYSDIPNPPPAATEQVREDGKVSLHLNYEIMAAGKTRGELEREIRNLYVKEKQVYKDIKISVQSSVRYVSVGGEVRLPGNVAHPGDLTVLKAINAAGGFTDFANKKQVIVSRDGKTIKVNCKDAIDDPSKDPAVFPGDRIHVKKKVW